MTPPPKVTMEIHETDRRLMQRTYDLAIEAERGENLPIACVITRAGQIVAEGINRTRSPIYHPGRHAEIEALGRVPHELWADARELTLYTSLEPCLMCFGTIVLHGIGRVVYGAADPRGGALALKPHLPAYALAKAEAIRWQGPVLPELFDPLCERTLRQR